MTDRATLELTDGDDACTATLAGEVDSSNAQEICSAILDQISSDVSGLVIDLSALTYMDSSGVAVIFRIARALTGRRQALALAVPADSPLRRLFEVTSVESVAPLGKDVSEARSLLSSPHQEL